MPLDPEKLQKPVGKRRKIAEKTIQPAFSGGGTRSPHPHSSARSHSACAEAGPQWHARWLLGAIASIRKRAGEVRDMDVLTGFVASLTADNEEECRVQLIEALGAKRARLARKLRDTAARRRSQARRRSGAMPHLINRRLTPAKSGAAKQTEWPADAMAVALQSPSELAQVAFNPESRS